MALANALVNEILTEKFANAGAQYLALHVADPTNAGLADTELSVAVSPNYARKLIVWQPPSNRSVVNANLISWLAMPQISIGYMGIWSAPVNGRLLATLECEELLTVNTAGGAIHLPEGTVAVAFGGSPGGRATPQLLFGTI